MVATIPKKFSETKKKKGILDHWHFIFLFGYLVGLILGFLFPKFLKEYFSVCTGCSVMIGGTTLKGESFFN